MEHSGIAPTVNPSRRSFVLYRVRVSADQLEGEFAVPRLLVLLYLILLVVPSGAQTVVAQEVDDVISSCEDRVVSYREISQSEPGDWMFHLLETAGGGALYYFGAVHSRDPEHEQVSRIQQRWSSFGPTIAFYEGPDRGYAGSVSETVAMGGESALVRYLAGRDSVEVARLEPSPIDEARFVLERFPAGQVKLFYVLREASRLREVEGLGAAEIKQRITRLLERAESLGKIGETVTTLEELKAAYRSYWTDPADWWNAPSRWFDPLVSSDETGGLFTNEINGRSSHYRNVHMFRVLAAAALDGKRVFAVVGRNHVPMQESALRCVLDESNTASGASR